ncbi:PrgI family protein, partial [candidate division WWE3 bacterium]|nr:PrgI family protein [candidate division WWE3 bacterium]
MPINEVQQTVKQHAVPQNIMQVEFKVIGELTMRQFFYLVIAAVLAFGMYKTGLPSFLRLPLTIAVAGAGVAIAFVPIQDRGMDQWVVNFFNAIYSPTQRVWNKEPVPPEYFLYQSADLLKSELLAVAPTASRRKLEQYLEYEKTETAKDATELLEEEYINKVREAFAAPEPILATQAKTLLPTTPVVTAAAFTPAPVSLAVAPPAVEAPVVSTPLSTPTPTSPPPPPSNP